MDQKGMTKFIGFMFFISLISMGIVFLWNHLPIIKNTAHAILNPTAGALMDWNITFGFIIILFIVAVLSNLAQKYGTDQETLKELKKEQKEIQKEMKKYQKEPDKVLEFNKKQMELVGKIFSVSMKGSVYTIIPFILLFRWFMDYFAAIPDFRFFGFFTWFWAYLLGILILSSIVRKLLKVA